ncbi:uncharacterized protein P884DRAFT_244956 [Thermothelomyces heterothallicus CBS 202.75]|uniref:uncharacterized protein n=1 Tax=Thermothelomyces heterothallicus CBS 202.75 TaxID=1149848 RepID=UPI00374216DA
MMLLFTSRALRLSSTTTRPAARSSTQIYRIRFRTRHISPLQTTIRTLAIKLPNMAANIPLATLGANPEVAKKIQDLLLPEYDLVHICLDLDSAIAELPGVCAGGANAASLLPSSGLGSNVSRPAAERKVPRGIIFGAGISDGDLARVMDAVKKVAPETKVVRVTREAILAKGAQTPSPEIITKVLREILAAMVEKGEL